MKLIEWLLPPPRWRIPVVIVLGALSGLILYTAYVSRATSYQSDSPTTCVNWHVVAPQYATWSHRAHREDTADLVQDVVDRQDKIIQSRDKLEELLVHAHVEANRACDLDATEAQIRDILQDIRHALWRCDYAAASQGGSFHSPVEIGRVISAGLPIVADARLELARLLAELGHSEPVPYPDISTKKKAQAFIRLDVAKLKAQKAAFKKNLLPT
jgi:nitrite reductase (cytochrome c-552)